MALTASSVTNPLTYTRAGSSLSATMTIRCAGSTPFNPRADASSSPSWCPCATFIRPGLLRVHRPLAEPDAVQHEGQGEEHGDAADGDGQQKADDVPHGSPPSRGRLLFGL